MYTCTVRECIASQGYEQCLKWLLDFGGLFFVFACTSSFQSLGFLKYMDFSRVGRHCSCYGPVRQSLKSPDKLSCVLASQVIGIEIIGLVLSDAEHGRKGPVAVRQETLSAVSKHQSLFMSLNKSRSMFRSEKFPPSLAIICSLQKTVPDSLRGRYCLWS